MRRDDLVAGRAYALRRNGARGALVKVSFRGTTYKRQAKVRFEDGELAGLEDWVTTRELVCPWGERKAMLRDEERAARLQTASSESWDRVYEDAVSDVLTASGEENGFTGIWDTSEGRATRLWARAGLPGSPLEYDPNNYIDRYGGWHLSFETALQAAKDFAAREPDLVELFVSEWEDRMKSEGYAPGMRYVHSVLRQFAPRWALARSWMTEPARTADQKEIVRLQQLVRQAAHVLETAGLPNDAAKLQRALVGG